MTNFEFCRDSIHSKTTESCLLLFLCTLGTTTTSTTLAEKKNHHRDSRREERCSTCDIMLDQARSAQGAEGKSDPRLSATFALR